MLTKIVAFDETTFNPVGSITITGVGANLSTSYNNIPADLIRWGQNGLAYRTASQLYVLQSSIVKDITHFSGGFVGQRSDACDRNNRRSIQLYRAGSKSGPERRGGSPLSQLYCLPQ